MQRDGLHHSLISQVLLYLGNAFCLKKQGGIFCLVHIKIISSFGRISMAAAARATQECSVCLEVRPLKALHAGTASDDTKQEVHALCMKCIAALPSRHCPMCRAAFAPIEIPPVDAAVFQQMVTAIEAGNQGVLEGLLEAQECVPDSQRGDLIRTAIRVDNTALGRLMLGVRPRPALVGGMIADVLQAATTRLHTDPRRAILIGDATALIAQYQTVLSREDLARALPLAVATDDLAVVQRLVDLLRPLDTPTLELCLQAALPRMRLPLIRALLDGDLGHLSPDHALLYFAAYGLTSELLAANPVSPATWDRALVLICLVGDPILVDAFFSDIEAASMPQRIVTAAFSAACISGSQPVLRTMALVYPDDSPAPGSLMPPLMAWDPAPSIQPGHAPLVAVALAEYRQRCEVLTSTIQGRFAHWNQSQVAMHNATLDLVIALCNALHSLPTEPETPHPAEELVRSATAYAMRVMDSEGPDYPILMAERLPVLQHIVLRAALQRLIDHHQLTWVEQFLNRLPEGLRKWVAREHAQAIQLFVTAGLAPQARQFEPLIDLSGLDLP
ncbi:MAG: hypothetical protein RL235_512 [Chlamydiota bacterium]|jgi:hypothetical protein